MKSEKRPGDTLGTPPDPVFLVGPGPGSQQGVSMTGAHLPGIKDRGGRAVGMRVEVRVASPNPP
jgi:hypothetical protein